MIDTGPHRAGEPNAAHIQAWLISVLLHGTVVLAAAITVKQIQLAPQNDTFMWNVAMVSPAQPTAPSSNQRQVQSVRSTTSASPPRLRRSSSSQAFAQTTMTSPEQPAPRVAAEPSSPQLTVPLPPTSQTIQRAELIRHETVAPIASGTESGVKQAETPKAASTSTITETERASAQSAILEQTIQSEHDSAQTHVAAIFPTPSNTPAKRDYGWLSEAILRRVEELKHYPASARVDRAEGKVVVKAVIDEDGRIDEVKVFQSSGYPALDEAAIETMRQAAPFHLPHPLGQPRMTIKIPMSYRLDR